MSARARIVVLVGPSGVGKTTLADMLRARFPNFFSRCVTHTTRAPRDGEQNGVDYHFVEREAMEAAIAAGEFVEWAIVHEHLYGVSKAAVMKAFEVGKPLLILDVQGARTLAAMPDIAPIIIFLVPPSIDVLRERLQQRAGADDMELRLQNAAAELAASSDSLWDAVVVNDNAQDCLQRIIVEILKADHRKGQ